MQCKLGLDSGAAFERGVRQRVDAMPAAKYIAFVRLFGPPVTGRDPAQVRQDALGSGGCFDWTDVGVGSACAFAVLPGLAAPIGLAGRRHRAIRLSPALPDPDPDPHPISGTRHDRPEGGAHRREQRAEHADPRVLRHDSRGRDPRDVRA